MPEAATDDDARFFARFLDRAIPRAEWTHRAHVRAAYLMLRRHPLPEAIDRMRTAIQALNAANAVPEGKEMGYHETLTQAWMRAVDATMRTFGSDVSADAFLDCHTQLTNRHIMRLFYSRERITSWEAKERFIEPDLAPLPVARPS